MIVRNEGRRTLGYNISSGFKSYSILNPNSFVIYPNKLYQIHGDSAIALDIRSQLNNPNNELRLLFPRGIKVNNILTSNKSKVLSYLKKDSFLYDYFQSRDDAFPAITIEDGMWNSSPLEGSGSHWFCFPDYWTSNNSGFEYFIEEFADPSNERQRMIIKTLQEKEKLDSELGELKSKLYGLLGKDRKKSIFDVVRW